MSVQELVRGPHVDHTIIQSVPALEVLELMEELWE